MKIANSIQSDSILKRLEEHFGYGKSFNLWLNTYSEELKEIPFFLSLTEEGIKQLEDYLGRKK